MRSCGHCTIEPNLPFECQYCDGIYCRKHRLPEKHDCDGVKFLSDPGKRFESKFSDEVVKSDEDFKSPEPIDSDQIETVGTSPEPDWSDGKSPPVQINSGSEKDEKEADEVGMLRSWLRKLIG